MGSQHGLVQFRAIQYSHDSWPPANDDLETLYFEHSLKTSKCYAVWKSGRRDKLTKFIGFSTQINGSQW